MQHFSMHHNKSIMLKQDINNMQRLFANHHEKDFMLPFTCVLNAVMTDE